MLTKLKKEFNYSVLHIAGREYRVRYSLNALLCLEVMYKPLNEILKIDFIAWTTEDVLQLAHAAMCDMPWNKKIVNSDSHDRFMYVRPTMFELGQKVKLKDIPILAAEIMNALLESLPEQTETDENPSRVTDERHQRESFLETNGVTENDFWNSTLREISEKIEVYEEVKGYKE